MKMMKSALTLTMACTVLLAGCSSGSPAAGSSSANASTPARSSSGSTATEEQIKLNFMHYFTEEEANGGDTTRKVPREQIGKFAIENPNIILEENALQINDYETKIQALAAADDMPDVFMVKGSWVGNFVENGLMADMTPYVESCEWKNDYRDNIFDPATRDGVIYAAPTQYSSTTLMFFNKALWNDAGYADGVPATWEEFLAAAPKFQEKNIYPLVLGNKNKWQYNSSWISALGNRYTGSEWFDKILAKDGSANFTDPEFVSALAMTQKIGQEMGLNPDYATVDHQQAASQYCQGKAATCIDGYWSVQYLIENSTPEVLANTVIAYLPTVEGAKGDSKGIAAGCGWFLAVNSKLQGAELDAAMKLVLDITGPKTSKAFADGYGMVHACDVENMDMSKFPQLQQDTVKLLSECTPIPIYDARIDASVIATMNDQFPELLAGNITPEKAAEAIQAEFKTTLK